MFRIRYYSNLISKLPRSLFRRLTRKRCAGYDAIRARVVDKTGLEIGGPSRIFRAEHLVPVYNVCKWLDMCNFSHNTIWTNSGDNTKLGIRVGNNIVADASHLSPIPDNSYDFLLASHVLEHVANPLKALREWNRVVKPGGLLLVIVPRKESTFDHRRPDTPFSHIESDFSADVPESDLTHLEEILELHDLEMDPRAGSWASFRDRCLLNPSIRAMHHHVFSPAVMVSMFEWLGIRVLSVSLEHPIHLIVAGQKFAPAQPEETGKRNREAVVGGTESRELCAS